MVDSSLLYGCDAARRLSTLFVDLNSYFASVEQQEQPRLRGKPIAVAAVGAERGTIIAASYEAKRFGVKTGTIVEDARKMCPSIEIVGARPAAYTYYHDRIVEAVEAVLPVDKVKSVDEMQCRLIGKERQPEEAAKLGVEIKNSILKRVGICMTSSVGVAPNPFLAKLASDMQKPNGLVILEAKDLPGKLLHLELTDLCGINVRMRARLNASGIFSMKDLLSCSPIELRKSFGSVIGERWWYLLRGYDLAEKETSTRSLGHSHVLAPQLRTDSGSRDVLLRLATKATARMRANDWCAKSIDISVSGIAKSWRAHKRIEATQDTVTVVSHVLELWENRDFARPVKVGITFTDLCRPSLVTPSLFETGPDRVEFSRALDEINQKFGKNTIYLAGLAQAKDAASEKIAFTKTWLFKEGKGDHEWTPANAEPEASR